MLVPPNDSHVGAELPGHKQYEFSLAFLDRLELRAGESAFVQLNALGAAGWRIVNVRDDPQHSRDLIFFMEREKPV